MIINVTNEDIQAATPWRPDANAVVLAMHRHGFHKAWANQTAICWSDGKTSHCMPMPSNVKEKLLDLAFGIGLKGMVSPFSFEIQ